RREGTRSTGANGRTPCGGRKHLSREMLLWAEGRASATRRLLRARVGSRLHVANPPHENALSRPLLARSLFGSYRTGLVDLRTRIDEAGARKVRTPVKRNRGGEAEEAGAAHAKLRGALVDPRNQALRQIDIHPLGRIGRTDANNGIGDECRAGGHRD